MKFSLTVYYLPPSIQNIIIKHVIDTKVIKYILYLFFGTKALKPHVCVAQRAHLNSDLPAFLVLCSHVSGLPTGQRRPADSQGAEWVVPDPSSSSASRGPSAALSETCFFRTLTADTL